MRAVTQRIRPTGFQNPGPPPRRSLSQTLPATQPTQPRLGPIMNTGLNSPQNQQHSPSAASFHLFSTGGENGQRPGHQLSSTHHQQQQPQPPPNAFVDFPNHQHYASPRHSHVSYPARPGSRPSSHDSAQSNNPGNLLSNASGAVVGYGASYPPPHRPPSSTAGGGAGGSGSPTPPGAGGGGTGGGGGGGSGGGGNGGEYLPSLVGELLSASRMSTKDDRADKAGKV
jgi:hypothetical protein